MPHDADYAAELTMSRVEEKVAEIRAQPKLKPTGNCHHCDEPTTQLFCDEFCRDDFQKREQARKRSGK